MKNYFYLIIIGVVGLHSCKPTMHNSVNEKDKVVVETPLLKSKSEGYFRAIGTEPFWNLDISEDMIRFQGIEESDFFTSAHVEPVRAMDANVKMYKIATESGEMNVTISQENCSDMMSENVYEYKVTIEMKRGNQEEFINYSGCGVYQADYRLYDIWVLEELEGKKVASLNSSVELPFLEINSSEKKFMGFAGCNRINGQLFQERELLRFTNIISTKMACVGDNLENSYLKTLQSTTGYKVKNNRLYLVNSEGIKIVFKKID